MTNDAQKARDLKTANDLRDDALDSLALARDLYKKIGDASASDAVRGVIHTLAQIPGAPAPAPSDARPSDVKDVWGAT